jgi:microcin C transport system substrate-binding protein
VTRRHARLSKLIVIGLGLACATAHAEPRHGLSAFGELKYKPDFAHLDYVNPKSPKAGRLSLIGPRGLITFDSFNGYILKGDAAQGLSLLFEGHSLIFDSLMTRAHDEPDAVYGLIAQSADVAADRSSVTFRLRPEAKFADGTPVTSADVAFSFTTLKEKGHPTYRQLLRNATHVETPDPLTVRYAMSGTETRDLPMTIATLPVFSRAFYAARAFDETSLEPPLGSGPYRIGDFKQGTFVSYKRRDDYWGKDLAINRGRWNFDEVRYEYYRDRTAALESLKAGAYDLREEFTAKDWSTAYDIPQVRDGRMQRLTLPDATPSGTQGFFINTRRAKFADLRVRKALDLAFDYEWANKNLFYGLYRRTTSYFENSPMRAEGKPSQAELAVLEPHRAKLPPAVFAEPYVPPVSDGSGADRKLLREAAALLTEAGWSLKDGKRTNATGEVFEIEFLIFEPSFERILGPYVKSLQAIGVTASIRRVDPAQYERRLKAFDFDILTQRYVMRLTPGVELKNYFGSEAAKTDGSFNLAGIADPVVDALIQKIGEAKSRDDLVASARALDRVLRAGHYWVPHWNKASHTLAYWDRFARPAVKPAYDRGIVDTWWYDAEKAGKLKSN